VKNRGLVSNGTYCLKNKQNVTVRVNSLKPEDAEPKFAMISAYISCVAVDQEGGSQNIALAPNQEVCSDEGGHSVGQSSPDCKIDLYLEEIDTGGDPILYRNTPLSSLNCIR